MSGEPPERPLEDAFPTPAQETTGGSPAAGQPLPDSSAGEQQPYTYPPPPLLNQTWPPPPGGSYPFPSLPTYPMQTNGVLILVLGIVSIVLSWICGGIGGLIGIIPWVMGNSSLKAIDQGLANPMERSTVNGGRICGIIGIVLALLIIIFYGVMFAVSLFSGLRHGS